MIFQGFLTVWTDLKYKYARAVLFLFLVSHVLIVAHPVHVFDLSYIQLFKAVDSVRLVDYFSFHLAVKAKINCSTLF